MNSEAPYASHVSLLLVVLGVLVGYGGIDLALQRISPVPDRITEVADGVRAYQAGDPDTLVLGSSHARSFEPLRDLLADPRYGARRVVVVPAEWGTFTAYRWVLEHRLGPLIDARDGSRRLRDRLQRALLITTFYDLCKIGAGNIANLPARAWAGEHFAESLLAHGLTGHNRNFVQTQWRNLLSSSVLVQNRGYHRIQGALLRLGRRIDSQAQLARGIEAARGVMERQHGWCDDPDQKRELRAMIQFLLDRHVEVTVVLFPLMPAIVSAESRRTTLQRYADHVAALARELPIRVVDLTYSTPMVDTDFQADFDHLTPAANHKFSAWAIEHDLGYLKTPRPAPVSTHAREGQP